MKGGKLSKFSLLNAKASTLNELSDFYMRCGYGGDFSPNDEVFYAKDGNQFIAVVRLALEEGIYILRGMQVLPCLRGNKIGVQLLSYMMENLPAQGRTLFCLPHSHLTAFYERAGFIIAEPKAVPDFLLIRRANYAKKGLNIELMVCSS